MNEARCMECDEIITNPLCGVCLAEEVRAFAGQNPIPVFGYAGEGNVTCIRCHRSMGLCAHCFCRDIYDYLRDEKSPLATEFLSRFDFDLRKTFQEDWF